MKVLFNGKDLNVSNHISMRDFLNENGYKKSIVVFLNNQKMLMQEVDSYILSEDDNIKIFRPLSGG